jgi:dephospho-CoA kinase
MYITDREFVAFLLGLTGNIACGKSTVGQLLAERYGADDIDADRLVHALYAAGTPETAAVAARFGAELVGSDGTIDRRKLGDIVMSNKDALKDLERILDPGVRQAIEARVTSSTASVVVLDAIRLIEGGLFARCDAVWVVICDQAAQLARLQATRNLTEAQAKVRIAAQTPPEAKLKHATAVLTNDGSVEALVAQVEHAWDQTVRPKLAQRS